MTIPNLIIAGAPKSGTSTLFRWLADHPEICGSCPKETFFLMDQDSPLINKTNNVHVSGLAGYSEFFSHYRGEPVVLDATTHYMYQRTPLDVLPMLECRPKVLFVLRDPAARVVSSFRYTSNNLARVHGGLSLSEFLRLVQEDPEALAKYIRSEQSLFVLQRDVVYGRYVDWLRNWREVLGSDSLKVLTFEEAFSDPRRVMKELATWVGVSATFYDSYALSQQNATRTVRSRSVQRVARAIGSRLPTGRLKLLMKKAYYGLQEGVKPSGGEAAADLIRGLARAYAPYNERLAVEWNLDLSSWR